MSGIAFASNQTATNDIKYFLYISFLSSQKLWYSARKHIAIQNKKHLQLKLDQFTQASKLTNKHNQEVALGQLSIISNPHSRVHKAFFYFPILIWDENWDKSYMIERTINISKAPTKSCVPIFFSFFIIMQWHYKLMNMKPQTHAMTTWNKNRRPLLDTRYCIDQIDNSWNNRQIGHPSNKEQVNHYGG